MSFSFLETQGLEHYDVKENIGDQLVRAGLEIEDMVNKVRDLLISGTVYENPSRQLPIEGVTNERT